ncbi:TetR/AcrR family transcriptional regulator [Bacillus siamensis]|uniref:TetR/AcrR family transcriptional regulator n=2 Tax=Bacillus siamensis TaxID=659243 RepID=UPI0022B7723D|nr:TetR/AcrR family transcriptional regulator [Bacillus siamensis]MDU0812592.1 TetR family transcriptional regulator C-terminal domain-containing protein [Bacillus siamensis]
MTSNSPGKRKSEKTKKELIDVARDLFAKKGYSETSIRDILTAANISKGNLYHHFKGKEFLFLHIMEQDTQEWIDVWTEKNGQYKNAIEKMYGLAEFMIETNINYSLLNASEEFFASAFSSKEVVERLTKLDEQYYVIIEDILSEGINDGSWVIDNIQITSKILSGLFYSLDTLYRNDSIQQKKGLIKEAIKIFIKGIS